MKSQEYAYCRFDAEKNLLYHRVSTDNCANMEQFILSMSVFTTLIDRHSPRYILIEILQPPQYFEDHAGYFVKQSVLHVIENAGVEKIAFVVSEAAFAQALKPRERNDRFQAHVFSDMAQAEAWLET